MPSYAVGSREPEEMLWVRFVLVLRNDMCEDTPSEFSHSLTQRGR